MPAVVFAYRHRVDVDFTLYHIPHICSGNVRRGSGRPVCGPSSGIIDDSARCPRRVCNVQLLGDGCRDHGRHLLDSQLTVLPDDEYIPSPWVRWYHLRRLPAPARNSARRGSPCPCQWHAWYQVGELVPCRTPHRPRSCPQSTQSASPHVRPTFARESRKKDLDPMDYARPAAECCPH